ncbi:hypothetical protein LR48_Vigan05g076200 [Vigna angularis]|uniref:Uncharacterized protein n=1 Tax=Phaseolus angularis TaxID=3914 RepID=A0A0L9UK61_PHAAN|nr:hypothetical protein LR48_Vigan05g076200 [Vigna angularis]
MLKITSNNATRVHTKSSQQPGKLTFDEGESSTTVWRRQSATKPSTVASLRRRRVFDYNESSTATNLREPSTAASEPLTNGKGRTFGNLRGGKRKRENCDGEKEKKT